MAQPKKSKSTKRDVSSRRKKEQQKPIAKRPRAKAVEPPARPVASIAKPPARKAVSTAEILDAVAAGKVIDVTSETPKVVGGFQVSGLQQDAYGIPYGRYAALRVQIVGLVRAAYEVRDHQRETFGQIDDSACMQVQHFKIALDLLLQIVRVHDERGRRGFGEHYRPSPTLQELMGT